MSEAARTAVKPRAIIYIGASAMQLHGVEAARAAGLRAVVTDMDPQAAGRALADRFEVLSATDVPGLLALAAEIDHEFNLVGAYGVADYAYEAVGAIAARYDLPIGTPQDFTTMADKAASHAALTRGGLAVPRQMALGDQDTHVAAASMVEHLPFPVVVKPANDCNSRGVHTVFDRDPAVLAASLETGRNNHGQILVETLVQGTHFNVDGLLCEGTFNPVAISERTFIDNVLHQPLMGFIANDLAPQVKARLWDVAARAAMAVGRRAGPVTVDIIDGAGEAAGETMVLEVSPHFHCIQNTALGGASAIRAWFAFLAGRPDWRATLPGPPDRVIGYLSLYAVPTHEDGVGSQAIQQMLKDGLIVHTVDLHPATGSRRPAPGAAELASVVFLDCESRDTFLARADEVTARFAAAV